VISVVQKIIKQLMKMVILTAMDVKHVHMEMK